MHIFTGITKNHLTKFQVPREKGVHRVGKSNITDIAATDVLRGEGRNLYNNHEPPQTAFLVKKKEVFGHKIFLFNPLKPKRRRLYLKPQSVPRCKHFSSRL